MISSTMWFYTGFPSAWSHHIIHLIHKSTPNSNPNNYRTIMVGHTFSKLYATVLHILKLSSELEHRHLRARGQARFRPAHQTIDHIFTLRAIIEEARHGIFESLLLLCRFSEGFRLHVPREALFHKAQRHWHLPTLLTAIMHLYESVLGLSLHNSRDIKFHREYHWG
jgi:hypothetical protein